MTQEKWPDEIRLKMIEKSEFYQEPTIYQYGYYDGYQEALLQQLKAGYTASCTPDGELVARKIVQENLGGLEDFISDTDVLNWYKDLIVTCMLAYAATPTQPNSVQPLPIDKGSEGETIKGVKECAINNWPDAIRLKMIERSEFYQEPTIYQYGYYDGYQDGIKATDTDKEAVDTAEMDKAIAYLALELPAEVWRDVNKKWQSFKQQGL